MKKLIKSIASLFDRIFTGVLGTARKFVKPAVMIVELLKKVVESDAATLAVAITKTPVDNVILQRARILLPGILHMLQLTDECLGKQFSNEQVIECALQKIKLLHPDAQKSTYLAIAGHLSAALSDGKFSFGEVVGLAWLIYHKEVKPALE